MVKTKEKRKEVRRERVEKEEKVKEGGNNRSEEDSRRMEDLG